MADPCFTSAYTQDFTPLGQFDPSNFVDLTQQYLPTLGSPTIMPDGVLGSHALTNVVPGWPIAGLAGISEIDTVPTLLSYDPTLTAGESALIVWETWRDDFLLLDDLVLIQAQPDNLFTRSIVRGAGSWSSAAAYYSISAISSALLVTAGRPHEIMHLDLSAYCSPPATISTKGRLVFRGTATGFRGTPRKGRAFAQVIGD